LAAVEPEFVQDATGTLALLFGAHVVVVQAFVPSPAAAVHDDTPVGPVVTIGQSVAVQLLPAFAATGVHDETPTGGVVTGGGQVVLVQVLSPDAATGTHDATGVGAVVMGAGQLVVVQRLAAVGPDAVHASTGTLGLLLVPQTMSTQPLAALAVCGVHESTGVFAVVTIEHVVPTQLLAALGGSGTQVPACTGLFVTTVEQLVCWWPLASVAGAGVHDATLVGPLSTVGAGQVVVVQRFPAFAPEATHELTATLLVLLFEQLMVVQALPALATAGVQTETGRFVTTKGAGHVVSVQLLPALATAAVQLATGTFVVVTIGQIVAV
jgi:hypothetical protein